MADLVGRGGEGRGPSFSQFSEPIARDDNSKQTLRRAATGQLCNDTPSRRETLAIKISTTTPVLHQKTRQIGFTWHLE
jgi:hypothetical protein